MSLEPSYNIAFARLGHFLPFLHMFAAALLMGVQTGFWMIFRFFMNDFLEEKLYKKVLQAIKFFVYMNLFLIILIAVTGIFLGNADAMKSADPMASAILITKYGLNGLILANTLYIAYIRSKSLRALRFDDIVEMHENLVIILKYFMPFSVLVAMLAVYLGVAYRNF